MKPPVVEIVSTGTEILQGLYSDRNATALSQRLDAMGFYVQYHHAVRDHQEQLATILDSVAKRAQLLVMTGGLGPTEDDINRDVIARLWNAPTQLDSVAESMMRARFELRNLPMPERNIVQAMIPMGATVFYNHNGTAPGFALPPVQDSHGVARAAIVALPGPSKEWIPMWEQDAAPWVNTQFPQRPARLVRTLHATMIPESTINENIRDLFTAHPDLEITLLAERGCIRIRLIATTDSSEQSAQLVEAFARRVLERLPAEVILSASSPEWSLEQELHTLLAGTGRTVSLAESCTGGLIAARITDIAGASEYFQRAYVCYSNEAKIDLLGVTPETLQRHGAVSQQCALEMAQGARLRARAHAALAVTGIAGPTGATHEKPVGTVCFALDSADREPYAITRAFPGSREAVREWASRQGLDLLRRWAARLSFP